jgi:hypothetical protein
LAAADLIATALMASTLLTGALPDTGLPVFAAAPPFCADVTAAGLAAGFAGAALWLAGLPAGFFPGTALVFDFTAVFDGITVLFAALEVRRTD